MVMSTPHTTRFQLEGYLWVERFLAQEICELGTRYARMNQHVGPGRVDAQVPRAYSVYGDPLMDSLAETVQPRIEAIIEEPLLPTFTYYRIYKTNAVLQAHMDRGACEVSVSICLGADHGEAAPEDINWPLWVKSFAGLDQACRMLPGDAVIYQGCDLLHWREAYRGEWQVQVFCHFVRQKGPFATLAKYDCRPALGMPESKRDPERCANVARLEWMRQYTRHLRLPSIQR